MAKAMGMQQSRFRAKYAVFAFIAAMAAYVLYHNESFLINVAHPVWHHYEPFKWWLLPHGVAGACALILAPMQFWERLRLRFTTLHRVTGGKGIGAWLKDHPREEAHADDRYRRN